MAKQTNKRPEHTIRIGAVKAAVWANETQNGTLHNVTISRSYRVAEENRRDGDDGWRESDSFSRDHLLVLARIAEQAFDYIADCNGTR